MRGDSLLACNQRSSSCTASPSLKPSGGALMTNLNTQQVSAAIIAPRFRTTAIWDPLEQPSFKLRWGTCLQLGPVTMGRTGRIINKQIFPSPPGIPSLKNRVENSPSGRVALPSHYHVITFSVLSRFYSFLNFPGHVCITATRTGPAELAPNQHPWGQTAM